MEKRICRNSGLELSVLGTGCWAFGGGEYWGNQDQNDVNNVVHASIDLGVNYFDTAEAYNDGRSEASLGEALRGIPRDSFLVGSKVSPSNCYPEILKQHCNDSLRRLRLDHIDIYMIHWPIHPHSIRHFTSDKTIIDNPPSSEEALEALRELRREGKIRFFGVSNYSRHRLEAITANELCVNQLPYNLLCRAIEYDAIGACRKHGIGIIGYMALLQGILADIYPSFRDIPVWQRRTRHFNSSATKECRHGEAGAEEETRGAIEGIRKICQETGIPMSDLAIRWILRNEALTCTLAGSRTVAELEANIRAATTELPEDIYAALNAVTEPVKEKLGNHFDYYESAENDRTE
jgi:aryl-alcohol dehydrogenase-like predicted oxidoreductase